MTRALEKDPTDVHVGKRLRERRIALGLSQSKLAEAIEVSFQQVQKYENGTNRVAIGRLQKIARALDVPISWFLDSAGGAPKGQRHVAEDTLAAAPLTREEVVVLKAYHALSEAQQAAALAAMQKAAKQKK